MHRHPANCERIVDITVTGAVMKLQMGGSTYLDTGCTHQLGRLACTASAAAI